MRSGRLLVRLPPHIATNTADHRRCSDNIITAAWENTLGVHALAWVSILFSRLFLVLPN